MAKVLVVTSGKGGVGKTTSTAALGAALAQLGEKVVVVDFDVGLRNLDLVMGAERRVVFDLINVVQGVAKLSQALIRDADPDRVTRRFRAQRNGAAGLRVFHGVIKEIVDQFLEPRLVRRQARQISGKIQKGAGDIEQAAKDIGKA